MPRAIIHQDKWPDQSNVVYKCECGQLVSKSLNSGGKVHIVVVQHGCEKCYDKWLKARLRKAEINYLATDGYPSEG